MTDEEIEKIARIKRVTEDDVRRVAADSQRIEEVRRKYADCTDAQAVMFLLTREKVNWE